jgi:hypothetical protein
LKARNSNNPWNKHVVKVIAVIKDELFILSKIRFISSIELVVILGIADAGGSYSFLAAAKTA